jgi:hypothetical protein
MSLAREIAEALSPHSLQVAYDVDGFPTVAGLRCKMCHGEVAIRVRRAAARPGFEFQAYCHGMWCLDFGELTTDQLDEFFSRAVSMPERIPEYEVDDSIPLVSGRRELAVSEKVARAARCGAEMTFEGVRGIVTGVCQSPPTVTLSEALP